MVAIIDRISSNLVYKLFSVMVKSRVGQILRYSNVGTGWYICKSSTVIPGMFAFSGETRGAAAEQRDEPFYYF